MKEARTMITSRLSLILLLVLPQVSGVNGTTLTVACDQLVQSKEWPRESITGKRQDMCQPDCFAEEFCSRIRLNAATSDEIKSHGQWLRLAESSQDAASYIEAQELIELFTPKEITTRGMRGIGGVTAGSDEAREQFQNILFDFDSDRIMHGSYPQLQEIGKALRFVMRNYPETVFLIEGHTDSVGDRNYNLQLSMRRARTVKSYLLRQFGLDGARITEMGFGEDRPVASNETEAGRSRNRRVEIVRR